MTDSAAVFAAVFVALYVGHTVGDHWIQTHHQACTMALYVGADTTCRSERGTPGFAGGRCL
jgi:hypothetical protein